MGKEVSSAIGTQRQFAKQPENIYQAKINAPNFMSGLDPKTHVDYDAKVLAKALGVIPTAIQNEMMAQEKREKDQATLVNAEKIFAGKTAEDLKTFNKMDALTNASDQFDLSDNKYAMAMLEKGMGKMASTYAKQQWAEDPNSQKPNSVQEAVSLFNKYLQQNRQDFSQNISNPTAFDEGYYEGVSQDTIKIANEAHTRISNDKRKKSIAMGVSDAGNYIFSGDTNVENLIPSIRQIEIASKDFTEFQSNMKPIFDMLADNELDGRRLSQIENIKVFGDTPLKSIINLAPYKMKIANRCTKEMARQKFEKYKLPNGGFDIESYFKDKSTTPEGIMKGSTPNVTIPVSQADNPDLVNLTPEMKAVMPKVGGVLTNLGYGDVMQLTSGYRDTQRNEAVGGAEGSYHTTGNALDIYIGTDITAAQQKQLEKVFGSNFGEVLFHDAGTGMHLHLGNYKGGIDTNDNDVEDLSYANYTTDRSGDMDKYVMAEYHKYKSLHDQEMAQIKENAITSAFKSNSLQDAYNVIDNSQLSAPQKAELKASADRQFKLRDEAKAGRLSPLAKQMTDYTDPMKATNVWHDMDKAKEYDVLVKQMNEGLYTPSEQEWAKKQTEYNQVARRLTAYWNYSYVMSNGEWGLKPNGEVVDLTKTNKDFPTEPNLNSGVPSHATVPITAENSVGIKKMISDSLKANTSKADLEETLKQFAKEKGYDEKELLKMIDEVQSTDVGGSD